MIVLAKKSGLEIDFLDKMLDSTELDGFKASEEVKIAVLGF